MVFKKTYGSKHREETTNRLRRMPTHSFRSNLSPEVLAYLKKLEKEEKKSAFINQAIQRNYYLRTNPKAFILNFLRESEYHYKLTKYILRQLGSSIYKKREKVEPKERKISP